MAAELKIEKGGVVFEFAVDSVTRFLKVRSEVWGPAWFTACRAGRRNAGAPVEVVGVDPEAIEAKCKRWLRAAHEGAAK